MSQDRTSAPIFQGSKGALTASLASAGLGIALLVIGLFVDRARFFFAYLTAYAYVVSIVLGALLFLMICHTMRATWPVAIRRLTEGIVSTLPILIALFIPLVFGMGELYPWLRPESVTDPHARHLIEHRHPYLNLRFFLIRTGIYFAIWTTVGLLLCRWSARRDRDPDRPVESRLHVFSAGTLPLVAIALTFASFDWLMSLEPVWISTMFPVYFFAGGFLGALAWLIVLTASAERAGLLPGISSSHYYALGRLLLGFTVFWAYAAFFQFMLQWMTNLPNEVEFYLKRIEGPWATMSAVLVLVHFVVPFLILLNYQIKRVPLGLATIAVWLLVAHYIDIHWLVVPLAGRAGFPFSFLDLGALLAVGGVTTAFGLLRLRGQALLPINDPALPGALEYKSV